MLQTESKKAIKTIINYEKQLIQTEQKKLLLGFAFLEIYPIF